MEKSPVLNNIEEAASWFSARDIKYNGYDINILNGIARYKSWFMVDDYQGPKKFPCIACVFDECCKDHEFVYLEDFKTAIC